MTVRELQAACIHAHPDAEVLVRIDAESVEAGSGVFEILVFEILSSDYSPGCTDIYALMLDCGLGERVGFKRKSQ